MTSHHSTADCRTQFAGECALILGGNSKRIASIKQSLRPHFQGVSTAADLLPPSNGQVVGLIVVTDEIDPPPDNGFVRALRRFFPRAKVLGIFDHFDTDAEIAMRSAGIVFWGSYERFNAHSDQILQTVEEIFKTVLQI